MGKLGGLLLGIDNQVACIDVDSILSKPYDHSTPRKPWSFADNGDVLEIVHEHSFARGRSP